MSHNREDFLEEILYEAHHLGVFDKFLDEVKRLRESKKYGSTEDIYETALRNLKNKE